MDSRDWSRPGSIVSLFILSRFRDVGLDLYFGRTPLEPMGDLTNLF